MFSLVRYYPSYWNNICFRSVFHLHQLLNVASVWCNSFFVVQQGLTIFHFSFSIYGLRFFYSSLISSSWYLFNYNALFSLNGWSFFRKKGNYKQGNHVLQIQKFPNNIHHGNASRASRRTVPHYTQTLKWKSSPSLALIFRVVYPFEYSHSPFISCFLCFFFLYTIIGFWH